MAGPFDSHQSLIERQFRRVPEGWLFSAPVLWPLGTSMPSQNPARTGAATAPARIGRVTNSWMERWRFIPFSIAMGARPLYLPFRPRLRDAFALALKHDPAPELGDYPDHVEHQAPDCEADGLERRAWLV